MLSRMQFKGVWRDYQRDVLEQMAAGPANPRLHVVAAPGAGKTVLGLEIVRRLSRPALIFAPSLAIRDQWAERLAQHFLDAPPRSDDLSRDLAAPGTVTLTTYQALDSVHRSADVQQLAEAFTACGPITLVLDEAHHLRREWWISIERLVASLPEVQLVALTATPPYDASFAEWSRYESLCGPVDLEIGIPELVRNGDLCPHQDHVVLSGPTEDALALLGARRRAIAEIQRDLWADAELLDALTAHPWLARPLDAVEAILEAPEVLSAILVLLGGAGRRPPSAPLKLLGVSPRRLPRPSFQWLETFLQGVLFDHAGTFPIGAGRAKSLRDRLHRQGLIEGGRVRLRETRSIFQLMASSLAKLDSIVDIARHEDGALGEALRMLVLSDHVRAGELPTEPNAPFRPAKPGVAPIFEHLRRAGVADGRLGVLTGTLVIIPNGAAPALRALLATKALSGAVRFIDLPACPGFVRVEMATGGPGSLVPAITALFAQGEIRVLAGTQALLGEGWDAPALNSLVLASNTASFMLSNQMRGRAIRTQPGNPAKVANIWHLATIEPPSKGLFAEVEAIFEWGALRDEGPAGLSDLALLQRRFRAFEGVANDESATLIESGIERLGLDLTADLPTVNGRTFATARDRAGTQRRWAASLGAGGARARVRETLTPRYAPRVLAWSDTLQALGWAALSGGAFAGFDQLSVMDGTEGLGTFGMVAAGAGAVAAVPDLAKAGRLMWRNGSVEGSLKQVGAVVLETLVEAGLAREVDLETAEFSVVATLDGRKDIVLRGVSRSLERQVMQAIGEILGPVENPRYLLVRRSRLGWRTRADYHAVPTVFGARKAWAEAFARLWRRKIGRSDLVFARTPEGRKLLLRARAKSLAAGFQRAVDRRSAWL